jgi:hypothetical protein
MTAYKKPTTGAEVMAELEMVGVFARAGRTRVGLPRFRLTDFGRMLKELHPGHREFSAAVEALARQHLAGGN